MAASLTAQWRHGGGKVAAWRHSLVTWQHGGTVAAQRRRSLAEWQNLQPLPHCWQNLAAWRRNGGNENRGASGEPKTQAPRQTTIALQLEGEDEDTDLHNHHDEEEEDCMPWRTVIGVQNLIGIYFLYAMQTEDYGGFD
eukprot:gene18053-biopygen8563